MLLPVTKIQRFSTHDGPGIRTTIFLKGCPLRCRWCHNAETQSRKSQIFYTDQSCIGCGRCLAVCPTAAHFTDAVGQHGFDGRLCTGCLHCADVCPSNAIERTDRLMSVDEIMRDVMKDQVFYDHDGGLTLSGGEPLLHFEGCLTLLRMAKEQKITTAIETSGFFDAGDIGELAYLTDIFLWDFKDSDDARHRTYTGVSNQKILENLLRIDVCARKIILRCIMVKTVNMDSDHFNGIIHTYSRLKNCAGITLLPYHPFGGAKKKQLGLSDNSDPSWIPAATDMIAARQVLAQAGCRLIE